jgi:nucleoside-diphosphate-sugar epimerase
MYGRAKLEIENEVLRLGGLVVRPGLIHGNQPGAIMGALDKAVRSLTLVPMIGNGKQRLYATHEEDLAALVEYLLDQKQHLTGPIIAACEQGMSLEQILLALAVQHGKTIRLLRVPWRLMWGSLYVAEMVGLSLGFRSDSVISFVNQDPAPNFVRTRELGVVFRGFDDGRCRQAHETPLSSR